MKKNPNVVNWYGGLELGKHVKLSELVSRYHSVVLALGSQKDKLLNIDGEQTTNRVYSSMKWTRWINGYPDGSSDGSKCDAYIKTLKFKNKNRTKAVVFGHGNVALDVLKMLLFPSKVFEGTDINSQALHVLRNTTIRHVNLVGRGGPLDASHTNKELRDTLNECQKHGIKLYTNETVKAEERHPNTPPSESRKTRRLKELLSSFKFGILKGGEWNEIDRISKNKKSLTFTYRTSPVNFIKDSFGNLDRTLLETRTHKGNGVSTKTCRHRYEINSAIAVKCIGQQTDLILELPPGTQEESTGLIRNIDGSVCGVSKFHNLYVSGWCRSGSVGDISSTMVNSYQTADMVTKHMRDRNLTEKHRISGREWLENHMKIRQIPYLRFEDWLAIDRKEIRRGERRHKQREKYLKTNQILQMHAFGQNRHKQRL